MMNSFRIPIGQAALAAMDEDDKLPYAPEGSVVRWYLDALELVQKEKDDNE
jgi:hypothetical protein